MCTVRRLTGRGNAGCLPRLSGIFTEIDHPHAATYSTWFSRIEDYQNKGVGLLVKNPMSQCDSTISTKELFILAFGKRYDALTV